MIIFEEGFFAPAMALCYLNGESPEGGEQDSLFRILIPLGFHIQQLQNIFRENNISYIDRAANEMEAMIDRTKTFLLIDTALFPMPDNRVGVDIEVLDSSKLNPELRDVMPNLVVTGELHAQKIIVDGQKHDNRFSLIRIRYDDVESGTTRNLVIRETIFQGLMYGPQQETLRKKMEGIAEQYPEIKDDETRGSMMTIFSSWSSMMDAIHAWDEVHGDDFKDQVHVVM